MDERRSELTPEQREAALKLADELRSVAIDSRLDMKPICLMMDGAKAIRDLHAENVRLREALEHAPCAKYCASRICSRCREDRESNRHPDSDSEAVLHFHQTYHRFESVYPCDCWKSCAALSGSPATEATTKKVLEVQP